MKVRTALIGGAAALVVLGVGGPFVYIHFIEGSAPAPLSLSSSPTTPGTAAAASSAAASGTVTGVWNVTSGSQAGYRIHENLFGQSSTAVGRTSAITGSITISGTSVTTASFTVDMTKVASDRSQRDGQFQGRIMDTSTFPTGTFALTQPIELGTLPAANVTITKTATGTLTLHGTARTVTFPLSARWTGTHIQVSGSVPITFAEYGIGNPSFGPVTTDDHGTMEFLLNLAR